MLNLRKVRQARGLAQKEVAAYLGVTQTAVSDWECGEREPDLETVAKIADFFDTTVDYLLGRTDELSPYPRVDTIAAHRTDDPMSELPEEARKSVEEFIDYVYKKYKNTNKTTP